MMDTKSKTKIKLFLPILLLFFASTASADTSSSVYFSGPDVAIAPDSEFIVNLSLDTKNPINAFDFEISYPKNKINFLGSDNSDSIVDIWHTTPSVLADGNVGFSGGLLKSFTGTKGNVVNLSFKVLSSGKLNLALKKSDLHLADGKATKAVVHASPFTISVTENGENLSSHLASFQNTSFDLLIREQLEHFKSVIFVKRAITLSFILIILVFSLFWVYNKRRK